MTKRVTFCCKHRQCLSKKYNTFWINMIQLFDIFEQKYIKKQTESTFWREFKIMIASHLATACEWHSHHLITLLLNLVIHQVQVIPINIHIFSSYGQNVQQFLLFFCLEQLCSCLFTLIPLFLAFYRTDIKFFFVITILII